MKPKSTGFFFISILNFFFIPQGLILTFQIGGSYANCKEIVGRVHRNSLVSLGGCGTAVLAGSQAGNVGISLAFGLTVLTMAYAIGHISGCHLNPAVTLGLWAGKRFPANEILPYIVAQVLGAISAAGILFIIASEKVGFSLGSGFASNGFGDHSPGHYGELGCFVTEVAMTFFFLIVLLRTHKLAPKGFAPMAIGLCLTLIHLISIPVTNTSVNPARSTGPAVLLAAGHWHSFDVLDRADTRSPACRILIRLAAGDDKKSDDDILEV